MQYALQKAIKFNQLTLTIKKKTFAKCQKTTHGKKVCAEPSKRQTAVFGLLALISAVYG